MFLPRFFCPACISVLKALRSTSCFSLSFPSKVPKRERGKTRIVLVYQVFDFGQTLVLLQNNVLTTHIHQIDARLGGRKQILN